MPREGKLKREAGENPVRSRHCEGELSYIKPLSGSAGREGVRR